MIKRRTITIGLVAVVIAGAAFLLLSRHPEQTALKQTRRALRQQGFKIDLAEFNFSTSPELRARAAALTNAGLTGSALRDADIPRRAVLLQERLDFMPAVGSNAALVVWKQEKLLARFGPYYWHRDNQSEEDLWPMLRGAFNEDRSALDAACEAALSGPIRFDLAASRGAAMSRPHLASLRNLSQLLDTRALLDLHIGSKDAAWTNLLVSTRLITAWDTEPSVISHLVRFGCTTLAYNATWQLLQADDWADDRLALLQHEWESVDFFRGLPETAAFARAAAPDVWQRDRQEPLGSRNILRALFTSPGPPAHAPRTTPS